MRGWISVSLILNVILLWRCWDARAKATATLEPGNAPVPLLVSSTKDAPPLSNQVPSTLSEPEVNESGFHWAEVESEDLAEFRDRLRAKGCPESLVRDLVGGRLTMRAAAKYRVILAPVIRREYWQTAGIPLGSPADEARAKQIQAELQADHLKLLGIPLNPQGFIDLLHVQTDGGTASLGWLPEDKRAAVQAALGALNPDAESLEGSRQDRSGGAGFEEQCAALKDILSPAEVTEYRLRHSPALGMERQNLKFLEPTRDELIQIEQALAHGPAEQSATEKIKQTLTPERAAEYALKSNPLWMASQEATVRFGLPGDTPDKLVALQTETETQAQVLRRDPSLTAQDRQAALIRLGEHAEAQVRGLLGENGSLYLPRSRQWLDVLKTAAQPTP